MPPFQIYGQQPTPARVDDVAQGPHQRLTGVAPSGQSGRSDRSDRSSPTASFTRRDCLSLAAAPLLLAAAGTATAQVVLNTTAADLQGLNLRAEGVLIDFPPLAETGFAVPLQASITAPPGLFVTQVEVFLPENPNTRALRMRLIAPQTHYAFSTRLRLAASQDVWVVATLSDGSLRGARAPTLVTSAACFDPS